MSCAAIVQTVAALTALVYELVTQTATAPRESITG